MRGNEYQHILRRIHDNHTERLALTQQLQLERHSLGGELLERFLAGRACYDATFDSALNGYGIALQAHAYYVLCVQMAEEGALFEDGNAQLAVFSLDNMLRELIQICLPTWTLYCGAAYQPMVYVLCADAFAEDALICALNDARQTLYEKLELQTDMGISSPCTQVRDLPELYRQATAALEFAQMRGDGQLARYPQQQQTTYRYSAEDELLIIQTVKAGQTQKALCLLDTMIEQNAAQSDPLIAQCLQFDLIATGLRIVSFADSLMQREAWHGDEMLDMLMRHATLSQTSERLHKLVQQVSDAMSTHQQNTQNDLSAHVCAYIHAHFDTAALSVAEIADTFDLHPTYLSRLFKAQMGVGVLEYLNRYRVERAQALLLSGQSVTVVAARSGYASDASFIRVFKQYVGVTPGKYRETRTE
ncbi:MAG: AraC family transcriptional regulator, partial [Clostridia bacterium]